jgi:hypothetical protein
MLNISKKSTADSPVVPPPEQLLKQDAAYWPSVFNADLLIKLRELVKGDPSAQTAFLIQQILFEGAQTMTVTWGVDDFTKAKARDIFSKLQAWRLTLADEYVAAFSNE